VPLPGTSREKPPLPPFNLFARLAQEIKEDQFRKDVLGFRKWMRAHHSKLSDKSSHVFPMAVEIRGFPDESHLRDQFIARIDFTDADSSRDVCFGFYDYRLADIMNVTFLRDDDISYGQSQHFALKERFISEWPGISTPEYCESLMSATPHAS
jgi:hypothetical protein